MLSCLHRITLKISLTRWTTLLSRESWWLHKISHTSHVPSFLGLIDLSKDISCAPEFSGRNCSHDIRELSKMSKVHTLFWKDRAFKYYHFVNSNSEHMFGIAVFSFLILSTHCFQQHCASSIFLLPCNLCVLGIHTCCRSTKIIITLLSESSNKIVHFEVWIKKEAQ